MERGKKGKATIFVDSRPIVRRQMKPANARHSLIRMVGDVPVTHLISGTKRKVLVKRDALQSVFSSASSTPMAVKEKKKTADGGGQRKKILKKKKKIVLKPVAEGTSSTLLNSRTKENIKFIDFCEKNVELIVAPPFIPKKDDDGDLLKRIRRQPINSSFGGQNNKSQRITMNIVSTPGVFDDKEELNRPPMYIHHTSYIAAEEAAVIDDETTANLVKEIFKDGIVPEIIPSPIITPAISTPSDAKSSEKDEFNFAMPASSYLMKKISDQFNASADLFDTRKPDDDSSIIEAEESEPVAIVERLPSPPKRSINGSFGRVIKLVEPTPPLRLRSGRTINRSMRTKLNDYSSIEGGSFQTKNGEITAPHISTISNEIGQGDNKEKETVALVKELSAIDINNQPKAEENLNIDQPVLYQDENSTDSEKDEFMAKWNKLVADDVEQATPENGQNLVSPNMENFDGIQFKNDENVGRSTTETEDDDDEDIEDEEDEEDGDDEQSSQEDDEYLSFQNQSTEEDEDYLEKLNQSAAVFSTPLFSAVTSRQTFFYFDPEKAVYDACDQKGPLPWSEAFSKRLIDNCVKIGEGCFGEVFRSVDETSTSVALKVIPIEGDFLVNDEIQKKFGEILPEIKISMAMSELRNNTRNTTPNFVEVRKVSCVQGKYPKRLIETWDEFHDRKQSYNDRPTVFDEEQLFIVLVFADGGCDLEGVKLQSVKQAESIVKQLTLTLAIAEMDLEFEHRDLHIGNVLIKDTTETEIHYVLNGKHVKLETHGVHVFIIDFTNSRSIQGGQVVYTPLDKDSEMFKGEGDYQFDIYRKMRDLNGNEWKSFYPKTNLLWLDYLLDKLITMKRYAGNRRMGAKQAEAFHKLRDGILEYKSCHHLVSIDPYFQEFLII